MHPVLAHYLNLDAAVDTLRHEGKAALPSPRERAYLEVALAHPERRALVLASAGTSRPSSDTQQALLFLATHAALKVASEEETLGPKLERARAALVEEGATEEEVEHLMATLVLEEAFGYLDEDQRFDTHFFAETLDTYPALASLTAQKVEALTSDFAAAAEPGWRKCHQEAAEQLFEAAWAEGPEPINPEHVEAALELLREELPAEDRPRAPVAMKHLLELLVGQGVMGPLRQERLLRTVDEFIAADQDIGPVH